MQTRVSFKLANPAKPLLLVPVLVNDKGPYEFALDTGASMTVLSINLASNLGIKAGATKEGVGAGGRVKVSLTSVRSVAIGEAHFDKLEAVITDLSAISQAVETKLDGIIGYNFLKNFKVTIDYPNNILSLE